jgi:phage gpG-like protein
MLSMEIRISGSKEFRKKIDKFGDSLLDLREPMTKVGEKAATYYANQGFLSQGGVFGAKWAPLSARYAAKKAKLYPGRPPLVRTGRMVGAFSYAADNNSVLVTNKMPYFKYHQSTAPRSKIPRRATMGINSAIKTIVRDIVQQEIEKRLRAV